MAVRKWHLPDAQVSHPVRSSAMPHRISQSCCLLIMNSLMPSGEIPAYQPVAQLLCEQAEVFGLVAHAARYDGGMYAQFFR